MPRHLLLYLHGHGSSPAEVDDVVTALDPDKRYIAVTPEGPVAVTQTGRAWFDDTPRGADAESLQRAVDWVRGVLVGTATDLSVDDRHVVLGGFSQGAATALAVAAALGRPLGGLLLQAPFTPEGPGVELDLRAVPPMPVLVQHGSDDDVVPPFFADHVATELTAAGCAVEQQAYASGHHRTPEMLDAARSWLSGLLA